MCYIFEKQRVQGYQIWPHPYRIFVPSPPSSPSPLHPFCTLCPHRPHIPHRPLCPLRTHRPHIFPFVPFWIFATSSSLPLRPFRPLQNFEKVWKFLGFQNLKKFHNWVRHAKCTLSVVQIGATFLTMSVPLMVATPIFGWLILSIPPVALTLTGYTSVIGALMLVGPPAYLPISPSYLLTEVGLGVLGIETAAICTSNFAQVQQANEDLSELGRRGPPQNGDQWGSLTSKSVGWGRRPQLSV